ncbi:MAG: bifunctional 4-hydroxy-2-oxoglutarate aldolase/2-dehydro-3-deoxy-phosphogluconate aldolase [Clostridia bacterium]|nr:bifunctional 4-hydroxy-2-oxoglutarate aldolase/2-dehydro-3-deoxy-phosphogluconate aldolase [Clostridia bacterium]
MILDNNVLVEKMRKIGVIPVVTINDPQKAPYLAEALAEGGIDCAEITFRTSGASDAIKLISKANKDFFVAAGTVLTVKQADEAVQAGAKLVVAPGFNPGIVSHCKDDLGVPVIPGVATPSEIDSAYSMGLDFVKFFPAEAMGGVKYLKAVSAPYHMMKYMPTGGISPENLKDYLGMKQVVCCGGSWIASAKLIDEGDFAGITKRAKEAMMIVNEVRT